MYQNAVLLAWLEIFSSLRDTFQAGHLNQTRLFLALALRSSKRYHEPLLYGDLLPWVKLRQFSGQKHLKDSVFNFVVCNPCQSSPSLTILVPLWFIIISLVFSYLCKVLFSGFLQFIGNFVNAQNNSKNRDCAPSTYFILSY